MSFAAMASPPVCAATWRGTVPVFVAALTSAFFSMSRTST
jgi:hypothetical protein